MATAELVRELTPYEPYFAENQSSLQGLTQNVLGALSRSVGLIAIMHPRGTVTFGGGRSRFGVRLGLSRKSRLLLSSPRCSDASGHDLALRGSTSPQPQPKVTLCLSFVAPALGSLRPAPN